MSVRKNLRRQNAVVPPQALDADRVIAMALAAEPFVGWRAVELVNNICTPLVLDGTWDRPTVYDTALAAIGQRVAHADAYGWQSLGQTSPVWVRMLADAIADAAESCDPGRIGQPWPDSWPDSTTAD